MNLDISLRCVSCYERVADDEYRVYVERPVPKPQSHRRVWCITEADRSSTCILLPDE